MKTWSIAYLILVSLNHVRLPVALAHEEKKPTQAHDHDHDDHGHDEKTPETEAHSDHGHEDHGEEHGEEEAPKNVGANKGITSYDEKKGFVLSAEATKNFRIESRQILGFGPWSVPSSALLITGEEKSIYRLREGFLKGVRVEVQKKSKDLISIASQSLRSGDAVVISGVGFLRIADVDLTSGESGHHH